MRAGNSFPVTIFSFFCLFFVPFINYSGALISLAMSHTSDKSIRVKYSWRTLEVGEVFDPVQHTYIFSLCFKKRSTKWLNSLWSHISIFFYTVSRSTNFHLQPKLFHWAPWNDKIHMKFKRRWNKVICTQFWGLFSIQRANLKILFWNQKNKDQFFFIAVKNLNQI